MSSGLIGGSAAAIIAVLVSLPLRSPSDTLLNSASVALASLLAGALAGALWWILRGSHTRSVRFLLIWTVLVVPTTLVVVLYGSAQLDNFTAFVLPLAGIIYLVTGILTIAIPRYAPGNPWWSWPLAVAVALALGFGLVTQTDQESGRLELPPPGSWVVPFEETGPQRNTLL